LEVRNFQVILGDQPDEKPRPVNQEAAYPMMAYRPHWRLTPDENGRFSVVDGAVNAERNTNIGFETAGGGDPDFWADWNESAGDGALADEGVLIHGGSHACKATAGATANTYVSRQLSSLTSLAPYTFSFWTRGDGTYAGRYAIWDATNAAWIQTLTTTGVTGTTYTQVVHHFTAPAGCVAVTLFLYCPADNTGIAYFDDTSLREQQTSGLVTIGEADGIEIAPVTNTDIDTTGSDQQVSGSFTCEEDNSVTVHLRYTDANNTLRCQIKESSGKIEVRDIEGGSAEVAEDITWAQTIDQHYRFRLVVQSTTLKLYGDDALLGTVTVGTTNSNNKVRLAHDLDTNDLKCVSEPYPKRSSEIIVAGGKATPAAGDPLIGLTEPDGSAFTMGGLEAMLFSITPWATSATFGAYGLLNTTMGGAAGFNFLRWGDGSAQVRYRDQAAYTSSLHTPVVGEQFTFMLHNRSSSFGQQVLKHSSGRQWQRSFVNEEFPVAASDTPVIYTYDLPMTLDRIALLDFSSIASADFSEVTDTKTNPADATAVGSESNCHINFVWTCEITKYAGCHFRYKDNDEYLYWIANADTLSLYENVGAGDAQLATVGGLFADATEYEIDVVANGTSIKIFVDKVLKISVTETSHLTETGGTVFHNLATNDIVYTAYPYPALGGNVFGATDRVVCPQVNDTFSHTPDFLAVERTIIAGASGSDVKFRIEDASNYMQRTVAAAGATHKLYKVVATVASALINGGAVDADDDITAILDGADGEILEDGASQGTTSGALFAGNASGSVAYAPEAIGDALELWPLYVYPPFTIPGL
jgi:hypothetical protein